MSNGNGILGLSDPRNSHIHKYGVNLDVDAAEDVIVVGGDYTFPAAVLATEIVSTAAADDGDPVGTGARTVVVVGLDTDYLPISETVTLNGVTEVVLTNQYLRINRAWVATAGSGGVAAGVITIQHTAGPATLATIALGKNQTEQAIYTVDNACRGALLHQFEYNAARTAALTNTADMQFDLRTFGGVFRGQHPVRRLTDGAQYVVRLPIPLYIPPRTDMRMRVTAVSAANAAVFANFDLELIHADARHLPRSTILM